MSDNGTDLIGAEWKLKETLNGIDQIRVTNFLSQHSIDWKFNPSSRPWMGGIWEALIKSVKPASKGFIQDRLFIDEMISTLMSKFQSMLNQRLLTFVSDDVNDYKHLTTYLLANIIIFHQPWISDQNLNLCKKWKAVQAASKIFRKRWIHE